MIRRNADGTVDHDGEYNPYDEMNKELANKCYDTGGFVMRIGTAHLGQSRIGFREDGTMYGYSDQNRYTGDGLMYVMGETKVETPWGKTITVRKNG
jgi:hypothetical protein